MRFMILVKATPDSEAGVMPSHDLLQAMGQFNQQLADAGLLQAGEGLHPSTRGVRLHFDDAPPRVTRGPFGATGELVSGFWIWRCASLDEAVAWASRCPMPPGAQLEIRQVFEAEDFGDAMTPELREQEERLRAQEERLRAQEERLRGG